MKALICGISGQDGAYLAQFLLNKGYEVIGTSRDAMVTSFSNLCRLGIRDQVQTASMAINDFRSVLHVLGKHAPDEIYNLAGQTSVELSFEQPVESIESIASGTLSLLEAIRFTNRSIRLYNAGSSECFGDTGDEPADENTPFRPRSPYAVAKASAHWLVRNYREAYGLRVCTGILFNHESPLRPERFVTQKIVSTAARIAQGSDETLKLGNIAIIRDWGWAPDYVDAMWRMLQLEHPDDFVIATGNSVSLEYFINQTFGHFGLEWQRHTTTHPNRHRPSDIPISRANPTNSHEHLGWKHHFIVDDVIEHMCNAAADSCNEKTSTGVS
ncbi:MAG: GDP-mannose 4,6-dehydratase [Thiobacillus sp.]